MDCGIDQSRIEQYITGINGNITNNLEEYTSTYTYIYIYKYIDNYFMANKHARTNKHGYSGET